MAPDSRTLCRLLTRAIAFAAAFAFPVGSVAAQPASAHLHLKRHPVVALTFDDAPTGGSLWPGETRVGIATRLISELKASGIKGAYGFVNGQDVVDDSDAQEALRILVKGGMHIGNHTWSHPSLNDLTAEAYEADIARNEPLLAEYAGDSDWRWFRYPYLEEGDTLAKRRAVRAWLASHGYRIAQVTLNFNDDDWDDAYGRCTAKHDDAGLQWLKQSYLDNARQFIRVGREEEKIAFGHEIPNVLLLHETTFTTLMLPDLVKLLRKDGFRFAPLARVERNRAYSVDPDAALKDGGSLPNQIMNSRHLKYPPFTPEPVEQLDRVCR